MSLGIPAHAGNQSELLVTFARPTTTTTTLTVAVGGVEFTVAYASGGASAPVTCPSLRLTDTLRLSPS